MLQPFDAVNQAMRDRDDKFTKRELIAMHVYTIRISSNPKIIVTNANMIEAAQESCKAADILLQELRKPPK